MIIDTPVKYDFTFTPAISIYVNCEAEEEIDALLLQGGNIFMPLAPYPFSRKFRWLADQFGVSRQLKLVSENP